MAIAVIVVALFLLLGAGVWVAFSLFAVGIVGLDLFKTTPVLRTLGQNVWNALTVPELLSLPLFILMAEVLFRTRLAAQLFAGLGPWTTRLPGRLLHVNVLGSTLFAAVSGSSAATAATIGRITVGELGRLGYDERLVLGSLAGAGTLGFLIPPSIVMIIYGVLAETSILSLFVAGIVPGLTLALLFMVYLGAASLARPERVPQEARTWRWGERLAALARLAPVLALIVAVIGSMYAGLASPTEAAAVGVVGALAISVAQRTLGWVSLKTALLGSVRTISMIGLILAAAGFLSVVMGYLGIPRAAAGAIAALELGPLGVVALLLVAYLLLGCVMDGMSVIVMTLPVALPLVEAAGYDTVWFGVFVVLAVEMAQITPPVGFNLFVLQGLSGRSILTIARAAFPFFLILLAMTAFIALVPGFVTWLPGQVAFR